MNTGSRFVCFWAYLCCIRICVPYEIVMREGHWTTTTIFYKEQNIESFEIEYMYFQGEKNKHRISFRCTLSYWVRSQYMTSFQRKVDLFVYMYLCRDRCAGGCLYTRNLLIWRFYFFWKGNGRQTRSWFDLGFQFLPNQVCSEAFLCLVNMKRTGTVSET